MELQLAEQELTPQEVALRERFVEEYFVDYDAFKAAIRCGFQPTFAAEWHKRLFQDVYVQRRMAEERAKKRKIDDEMARARADSNLEQLTYIGSEASRVAALRLLYDSKGWTKADTTGDAAQDLVDAFKDIAQRLPV